jgi:hypothetical protein
MREAYDIARHIASRIFDVMVEVGEKTWESRKDTYLRENYL